MPSIRVYVVVAGEGILRDGLSSMHGGRALAIYDEPRETQNDERCIEATLAFADPDACKNCGATDRPDMCSGGPWCLFPPHRQGGC